MEVFYGPFGRHEKRDELQKHETANASVTNSPMVVAREACLKPWLLPLSILGSVNDHIQLQHSKQSMTFVWTELSFV